MRIAHFAGSRSLAAPKTGASSRRQLRKDCGPLRFEIEMTAGKDADFERGGRLSTPSFEMALGVSASSEPPNAEIGQGRGAPGGGRWVSSAVMSARKREAAS